jgi:cyclase
MFEIDDNIFVETEKLGSNNAIIATPDGLVLVDTPHRPSDAIRWRRLVESMGRVEYLIHTDHHIDHTMGNYFLPGRIVSHAKTRERLMNAAPTRQYLEDLLAVIDPEALRYMDEYRVLMPTVTYETAMTLHVGGLTFEFTHRRGHTLNSSIIYLQQQQVAFVGDLVCSAGLPAFIEADTFDWIDTVRHIEQMDIRYLVPGHGPVCDKAMATTFRGWIEDLVGEVETRIDRGLSREAVAAEVTYEDYIHISTGGSPAYPQHLMDMFIRRSIETIYDQINERRARLRTTAAG